MAPKILFIILNHNSEEYLIKCISSVKNQSISNNKIVLVDNASTDNSIDLISKTFPDIEIISNTVNLGLGSGFNIALKKYMENYDYFVLMNSDVVLDIKWCEILINYLEENKNVWSVNGLMMVGGSDLIDNAGGQILNILFGIFIGHLGNQSLSNISKSNFNKPFKVFFNICNAMIIRKDVLIRVGFFDPSYFMYYEDIDLSWRILLNGHEVHCNPRAVAYHFGGSSKKGRELVLNLTGYMERNLLATYYKNISTPFLLIIFPILLVARLLGAVLYFFVSPRVTISKVNGIIKFFLSLGSYYMKRKEIQKFRVVKELEIYRNNHGSLMNLKSVFFYFSPWISRIKQFINE